jgi:hypothetical protein
MAISPQDRFKLDMYLPEPRRELVGLLNANSSDTGDFGAFSLAYCDSNSINMPSDQKTESFQIVCLIFHLLPPPHFVRLPSAGLSRRPPLLPSLLLAFESSPLSFPFRSRPFVFSCNSFVLSLCFITVMTPLAAKLAAAIPSRVRDTASVLLGGGPFSCPLPLRLPVLVSFGLLSSLRLLLLLLLGAALVSLSLSSSLKFPG